MSRRSISVRKTTYDALRKWVDAEGMSMSTAVEIALERLMAGPPVQHSERVNAGALDAGRAPRSQLSGLDPTPPRAPKPPAVPREGSDAPGARPAPKPAGGRREGGPVLL